MSLELNDSYNVIQKKILKIALYIAARILKKELNM